MCVQKTTVYLYVMFFIGVKFWYSLATSICYRSKICYTTNICYSVRGW